MRSYSCCFLSKKEFVSSFVVWKLFLKSLCEYFCIQGAKFITETRYKHLPSERFFSGRLLNINIVRNPYDNIKTRQTCSQNRNKKEFSFLVNEFVKELFKHWEKYSIVIDLRVFWWNSCYVSQWVYIIIPFQINMRIAIILFHVFRWPWCATFYIAHFRHCLQLWWTPFEA